MRRTSYHNNIAFIDLHFIFKKKYAKKLGCYYSILLYIILNISILNGQKPPAYFENSRDFVDKHDYSIICYPIISEDYTASSAHA